ncbi:hypothetical protein AH715_005279 [Salmonella enterica subsp. enterica]|nr:hypothetical protein [Salmonella enterica subsp. enterica]
MTDAIKACSIELIESLKSLQDAVIALNYVANSVSEGEFDRIEDFQQFHEELTKSFQVLSSSVQWRFESLYTCTWKASALLSSIAESRDS